MTEEERLDTLVKARGYIADPDNWTAHNYAETEDTQSVFGYDDRAVKWCAMGAIQKAIGRDRYYAEYEKVSDFVHEASREHNNGLSMFNINDDKGHEAVIDTFDYVIKKAAEVIND